MTMPKDLDAVESLLAKAVELDDEAERTQFIDQNCDESVRHELRQMVADFFSAGGLLDPPADEEFDSEFDPAQVPVQIGLYRLREKIAEGGMGVVFVADQINPVKRRVALKLIKPGLDSAQVISRFDAERQALAMMDHPNIATIFDAGSTEKGRPYFVMELVQGLPIPRRRDGIGWFVGVTAICAWKQSSTPLGFLSLTSDATGIAIGVSSPDDIAGPLSEAASEGSSDSKVSTISESPAVSSESSAPSRDSS